MSRDPAPLASEMTAEEFRLMHYRCAALGALIGIAHTADTTGVSPADVNEGIATRANDIARAMLAAEGT